MDTENINFEAFKKWLRYFGIGIWVLIFFGLLGFAILVYELKSNLNRMSHMETTQKVTVVK